VSHSTKRYIANVATGEYHDRHHADGRCRLADIKIFRESESLDDLIEALEGCDHKQANACGHCCDRGK
jgi:hypothetical protein